MTAKPKTPSQQRARVADKAPAVTLVPDLDNGEHPKATDTACPAVAIHRGVHVSCELAAGHPGDHDYNGLTWRRRSGDPE